MPEPVTSTQDNTQVVPTSTDVKATGGSALTGEVVPPTQETPPTQKPEQKAVADQAIADKAAADKAAADAGKTPEQLKAEADKAALDKANEEKAKGAPADGKYEFKSDDGKPLELDPELTTTFTGIAKELNLSNEDAAKIAKLGPVLVAKQAEAINKQWLETKANWVAAQKADTALGGTNYTKSLEIGNRGLAAALKIAPELADAQKQGLLDHPGLWKLLIHQGKILGEARTIDGSPAATGDVPAANKMYPNHN